jgi:hypothetical protein
MTNNTGRGGGDGNIYHAYSRSQISKIQNIPSSQSLIHTHLFHPLSLQMHTVFTDYKLLLARKNTEGAFALPPLHPSRNAYEFSNQYLRLF